MKKFVCVCESRKGKTKKDEKSAKSKSKAHVIATCLFALIGKTCRKVIPVFACHKFLLSMEVVHT